MDTVVMLVINGRQYWLMLVWSRYVIQNTARRSLGQNTHINSMVSQADGTMSSRTLP